MSSDGNVIRNNAANSNENAGNPHGWQQQHSEGKCGQREQNEGISLRNCSNCIAENNSADQNRYGVKLQAPMAMQLETTKL